MVNSENYMGERYCALTLGILFTVLGIAGFIPALVTQGPVYPVNEVSSIYTVGFGNLFGLFPINLVHNAVHFLVGVLGLIAFSNVGSSRTYCQFFALSYLGIALLGLLPFANTTFGLMPIFGNNVWFNALTAVIAGYFGFVKPVPRISPTSSNT
jgi:Domain of unknown function (DUF4383)